MPTGSTNFPGGLDAFPTTRGDLELIGPDAINHAAALNAVEAELGINPSGTVATVAARLDATEVRVVAPGNLGTAYTLNMASGDNVWLDGTLNANVAITLSGVTTGAAALLRLTQDATGDRTVAITDGVTPVDVPVDTGAGAITLVRVYSRNGTDWDVEVAGGWSEVSLADWEALDARLDTAESGHVLVTTLSTSTGAAATNKVIIDAALAVAYAAGGGKVLINQVGTFYTNGGHEIGTNVTVEGLRRGATVLLNRGSTYTFRLTDQVSGGGGCAIKRLTVAGSASGVAAVNGGIGIELSNGSRYDLEEMWIEGFTGTGSIGMYWHNTTGAVPWTGAHSIRHTEIINCTRCMSFVTESGADEHFGEISTHRLHVQPYASQVGFWFGKSTFYNSFIEGSFAFAGNNAILIEIATSDAKVRQGSRFHLVGEIGVETGCKRIKISTATGQFDASGKIFCSNANVPDDTSAGGVFNFVEDHGSFYESENSHQQSLASAGTLTLPGNSDYFAVTGTATITVIPASWEGRIVSLRFTSTATVSVAGNIRLASGLAMTAKADDVLMLVGKGGVWYECVPTFARPMLGGAATTQAGFGAWLTAKAKAIGLEAAIFQRFSSGQTADIAFAADESGNFYSGFSKAGYFKTRKVAAPADGDLVANDLVFWFDSTAGAAKLMIKAKNASGTVVTGSVNLT